VVRVLSVALLLSACSGDSKDEGTRGCTLIGCQDGFSVDFTPSGAWTVGDYEFLFTLDGETTTCAGSLPLPQCGTANAVTCSPSAEQISIFESGCALQPALHGFAGFQVLPPKAETVTLRLSREGLVLLEQSWTPAYQTLQPNGEGCGPTCESATDALTVPVDP
jgi:hypothetical protein